MDKAGSSRPLSGLVDLLFLFPPVQLVAPFPALPETGPCSPSLVRHDPSVQPRGKEKKKKTGQDWNTDHTDYQTYLSLYIIRSHCRLCNGDRKRNSSSVTNLDFFFISVLFSLIYSLISLSLDLSILQSTHPSIHPPIYLSIYPTCLSVCPADKPPPSSPRSDSTPHHPFSSRPQPHLRPCLKTPLPLPQTSEDPPS